MSGTAGVLFRAGGVKATNADLYVRTLGFRPTKLKVTNLTNQVEVEWHAGLSEGKNLKRIADGTLSVVASGGIVPVDADADGNPGFKVPAALADVNDTTTEDLVWEAWGGAPALMP
jgi:hypothetical protein